MRHIFSRLAIRRKARARAKLESERPPAVEKSTFQLLELPMDLRYNPFSRSTLSQRPPPRMRRQVGQAGEDGEDVFRIMDLPPELRLRILTCCFGNRTLPCRFNGDKLEYRLWPCGGRAHVDSSSNLALLRTSRQLGKEAMEALLNCTTFITTVDANLSPYSNLSPSAKSAIRTLSPSTVRHAVFYFDVWGTAEREVCRQAILVFGNLKTVDLHFDFGCLDCFEDDDAKILEHFITAKFTRVRAISSIGYRYEKHLLLTKKQYVPHNEVGGFRALVDKYKALDVSAQQCGSTLPCLLEGDMCDVNTGLLNDEDA